MSEIGQFALTITLGAVIFALVVGTIALVSWVCDAPTTGVVGVLIGLVIGMAIDPFRQARSMGK